MRTFCFTYPLICLCALLLAGKGMAANLTLDLATASGQGWNTSSKGEVSITYEQWSRYVEGLRRGETLKIDATITKLRISGGGNLFPSASEVSLLATETDIAFDGHMNVGGRSTFKAVSAGSMHAKGAVEFYGGPSVFAGDVLLEGHARFQGDATFHKELACKQQAIFQGNQNLFKGTALFEDRVAFAGNADFQASAFFKQTATFDQDVAFAQAALFENRLAVAGNADFDGPAIFTQAATFSGRASFDADLMVESRLSTPVLAIGSKQTLTQVCEQLTSQKIKTPIKIQINAADITAADAKCLEGRVQVEVLSNFQASGM